jgi:hypothetical protein
MFRSRSLSHSVADIRALMTPSDPAASGLDSAAQTRLAEMREQVSRGQQVSDGARTWWPRRPERRRRRVVITCIAAPALLAATAAGWVAAHSVAASRLPPTVGCYSEPALKGQHLNVDVVASYGQSPVTICAQQWANGAVLFGVHQVPALSACVIPGDMVGVFPDTTCAAMRLAPIPPGYDRAAWRAHAVNSYLQRELASCSGLPRAVGVARRAIRKFRLTGWRVTEPYGDRGLCWKARTDSQSHTVQVTAGELSRAFVAAQKIISRVLDRPDRACLPGSAPENTAMIVADLRRALRRGGYGTWTIVVGTAGPGLRGVGHRVSRSEPCYYPAGYHISVDAGLYHWLEIEPGSW